MYNKMNQELKTLDKLFDPIENHQRTYLFENVNQILDN